MKGSLGLRAQRGWEAKGKVGTRERYLSKAPACPACCVEPSLRLGVGAAQM